MQSKYTTKELIKRYTKKNKSFVWGVETVIDSLTHNVEYNLDAKEGVYVLNKWELAQPTSEEIKEELPQPEAGPGLLARPQPQGVA